MASVILGNGPMEGLGAKIDEFDTVARLKVSVLENMKGFEKDVGSKTDIIYDTKQNIFLQQFREKYPDMDIREIDNDLKYEICRQTDNYITNGVAAICQMIFEEKNAVFIAGFHFHNEDWHYFYEDRTREGYNTINAYDFEACGRWKKAFRRQQEKKARFGLKWYENREEEGKLIARLVSEGKVKWLEK